MKMLGWWRIAAAIFPISLFGTGCCGEVSPRGPVADSVKSLVEAVHQWQQDQDSASKAKRAGQIIGELVASLSEQVHPDGSLSSDVDPRLVQILPVVSKFKVEQEAFEEWVASIRSQDWPIRVAAYFLIGFLHAEDVRLSALRSLKRLEPSLQGEEWLDAVGAAALNEEDWALGREFASVLQGTKRKEPDGDGLSIEQLQALMEDKNADVDSKVVEVYLLWLSPKKLNNDRVVKLVSDWMDKTENSTLKEACAVCLSRLISTPVEGATLAKMFESDRPLVLVSGSTQNHPPIGS